MTFQAYCPYCEKKVTATTLEVAMNSGMLSIAMLLLRLCIYPMADPTTNGT